MTCDLSQYVIIEDPQRCAAIAVEASAIEAQAMREDRLGNAAAAVNSYRLAAAKLYESAEVCPDDLPDRAILEQHAVEVLARADYLEALDGREAAIPLQEHIHAVALTLGKTVEDVDMASNTPRHLVRTSSSMTVGSGGSGKAVMGAAAAITGATGLLTMGPVAGIALGAATAYAATREDSVTGTAARKVGALGIKLVDQASSLNRGHRIGRCIGSATSVTKQELVALTKRYRVAETLNKGLCTAGVAVSKMVAKGSW
eukprot:TRINITY_DN103495_c0_g1_i1.p1 TRINITY_DN103495_c0_g1~~TRINITY_DN103495_c0_g1_i1.p1  ORF type:complete len:270 (+),score=50.81 TRINITY_DN103495_c0_g1_i1:38-811(+)